MNGLLVEIVEAVVCTISVAKMKKHLLFYRRLSILYAEDRVVVDRVVFEREATLKDSILMGSVFDA